MLSKQSHLNDISVCSQFFYCITEGELCYTLNVQTPKTKAGMNNGISLILDAAPVTPGAGLQKAPNTGAKKNKMFGGKATFLI